MNFVLLHRKNKTVLCQDKMWGSWFKDPFYRGKLRKSLITRNNREHLESLIKFIEGTDINCPPVNELEIVSIDELCNLLETPKIKD